MMTSAQEAWLIARYAPVALFSLRPSITTAAGGQTLLVPTPYSVKLALTDAVARVEGSANGAALFNLVQPLEVRLRPPEYSVVTHTFNRVRWWARGEAAADAPAPESVVGADAAPRRRGARGAAAEDGEPTNTGGAGPWATRIAYREYCFLSGELAIAFNIDALAPEQVERLSYACAMVTYFGRRGGFFQFTGTEARGDLGEGFDLPANPPPTDLGYAVVQVLDDMPREPDPSLWDRISTFTNARVTLEVHRLVRDRLRVLPARRVRSSRAYTLYQRTL